MKLSTISSTLVGASILFSISTYAALVAVDIDGNALNGHEGVYDDVLDITWLADANVGGSMPWNQAATYIDDLNASNDGDGYFGVNTWRMPSVSPMNGSTFNTISKNDGSSDLGYQISAPVHPAYNPNGQSSGFTGNELAFHYYNNFGARGAVADCSSGGNNETCYYGGSEYGIDDASDPDNNKALFTNFNHTFFWTGTSLSAANALYLTGSQGNIGSASKANSFAIWLVASGNVSANSVPVPAAVWLFGSGLIGLLGIRKLNKDA